MADYLQKAKEMEHHLQEMRRTLHAYAECGFDLEKTVALVERELDKLGVPYTRMGKMGVCALVGQGEPCVLLRADMDALPMREETGLPFASDHVGCHSCGHDTHTAMLLGAAKMLKENEAALCGTVKLMFQPAEELLAGAQDMVEAGILENPPVKAAFAAHIAVAQAYSAPGIVGYSAGAALYSGDAIKIKVRGKASHGSAAFAGVDAINIAAHIVLALHEIVSREIPADEHSVVLVGKLCGGDTVNTTAGYAEMEVSVRTQTEEKRRFLIRRVGEIACGIAATFRGEAEVEHMYGMAPLYCDPQVAAMGASFCEELGLETIQLPTAGGTEDFTAVAQRVPAVMLNLGAGALQDGYVNTGHHPAMVIDEQVLPIGAAVYAQCATRYLEEQA